MVVKYKIDESKLTPEQRDKLDAYNQTQEKLTVLTDTADMVQEIVTLLDSSAKQGKEVGAVLLDIREKLGSLNSKEAPETPDYAKPVVEAVSKLESELSSLIRAIDLKPNIKVNAPQVNVTPPDVDLKGVEKALSAMPKAFEAAIKLIPPVDIPETDFKPLLDAWEGISEQLVSIENATRLKPLPGSIRVTNLSEVPFYGSPTNEYEISDVDDASTTKYYGFLKTDGQFYILQEDTAASPKTYRYYRGDDSYTTVWTNRATQTYRYYDNVF